MILDYLRRVSHLKLFGSVSITRQNRDPLIEWNPDYEKQWRDECTRRLTVSSDDRCDTPTAATIDISDDDEGAPTIAADLLEDIGKVSSEQPCINACIHVQPTAYQKLQCDQAVVGAESTLFNSKNRFERLLNILSHPDSEITHDNDMQNDKVPQSGKTAFLFEFLSRLASLDKTLDIAIMTNDHDTESVVYQTLRLHGYQCQRIPVILEDDWSSEHGVFFTTSEEASYTKWSARPSIDIILMFDIRINNDILSKLEGDKRMLWIINKDTVEDRAFSILQQESDKWQDVWRRNKALQNTMIETNSWDNSLSFEESVQKSADQAFDILFPGNSKRPRSLQADIDAPPSKRRPSIIILDSSDDEEIYLVPAEQLAMQPLPKPAPLNVNHFEIRAIEMIDHLLDFPEISNFGRKDKEVSKTAVMSRDFKDTATPSEKALYTSLQPRLESIEARFQYEYNELTDYLQSQYTEHMYRIQRRYKQEALDALDFCVATRNKRQPHFD